MNETGRQAKSEVRSRKMKNERESRKRRLKRVRTWTFCGALLFGALSLAAQYVLFSHVFSNLTHYVCSIGTQLTRM
jgi:hypothetical protein